MTIDEATFGRALPSLRVMPVQAGASKVLYLPLGLSWVDASGSITNAIDLVAVASNVIVSGRISILASSDDVGTLKDRVEEALGDGWSVRAIKPQSAHVWILDGGSTRWSRSIVGPPFERIPVQFAVPTGSPMLAGTSTGVALVAHEVTVASTESRFTVDWIKVREYLVEWVASGNVLADHLLSEVWTQLLSSGIIAIEVIPVDEESTGPNAAKEAFLDLLRSRLLEPASVTLSADSPQAPQELPRRVVLFRVREDSQLTGTQTYDLRTHTRRSEFYIQESTLHAS
jgi:hypothetical protein